MSRTPSEPPAAQAIVTVPPHAPFLADVARHPIVCGLRLNTVMPIKGSAEETLERLAGLGKPLWIDLKGRQLRVAAPAVPPFTEVRLSHPIRVRTPTWALFGNGREQVRVLEVDGDRLILEDGPRRVVGPGESVNIPCSSLEVEGTLTARDLEYVAAARALGLHDYMLSFVEGPDDVESLRALDPDARVVAKIESRRGLEYVRQHGRRRARLMAARGDLYVEVLRPHKIASAVKAIVKADKDAIVASRILDSMAASPIPASADIGDVAFLLEIGYRTFMLGDQVCLRRDSVIEALNLLEEMEKEH